MEGFLSAAAFLSPAASNSASVPDVCTKFILVPDVLISDSFSVPLIYSVQMFELLLIWSFN